MTLEHLEAILAWEVLHRIIMGLVMTNYMVASVTIIYTEMRAMIRSMVALAQIQSILALASKRLSYVREMVVPLWRQQILLQTSQMELLS